MQKGIQSWFKSIGDWGCYFLCLLDIAEEYMKKKYNRELNLDIFKTAKEVAALGYMKLNLENLKDTDNFYILEPHKILGFLTGGEWDVSWQSANYIPKEDEYVVRCFVNPPHSHFNRPNFDSLQNSYTVKFGHLDSYRIFRKVA